VKELTKKILEAGLVDKTLAQLLERWHLLTPEEAAIATKPIAVVEALEKFVENLEELLDQEPLDSSTNKPLRETKLEIHITKPPTQYQASRGALFTAAEDEMGRLITNPGLDLLLGERVWEYDDHLADSRVVGNIEKLYEGDRPVALQITFI